MRSRRSAQMWMCALALALAGSAWGQATTYALFEGTSQMSRFAGFPDNAAACERERKATMETGLAIGELHCVAGAADQPLPAEREATVDLSSKFRHPPRYPPQAALDGRAGRVVVLVKVDAQGLPTGFSIDASSGSPDLDDAALTAARHWLYKPALHAGQAQSGEARVALTFAPN